VLGRYDANWYGYLAKQRLNGMNRNAPQKAFAPDSVVGRAIANLQTVTVAEETAGPAEDERIAKSEQLNNIGIDEWALEELARAAEAGPNSPKVNLAIAKMLVALHGGRLWFESVEGQGSTFSFSLPIAE